MLVDAIGVPLTCTVRCSKSRVKTQVYEFICVEKEISSSPQTIWLKNLGLAAAVWRLDPYE